MNIWWPTKRQSTEAEVHLEVSSAPFDKETNGKWKGSTMPAVHTLQLFIHLWQTVPMPAEWNLL
jgi:hypothetical protein